MAIAAVAAAGSIPAANTALAGPSPGTACSWGAKSDPDLVNAAYPDTSATYWSYQYRAIPGTELVIHGTYPSARYFSFHVYQPNAVPIDSIYDAQIAPDSGSANPFAQRPRKGQGRQYTATVQFTAKPSNPVSNTIYAGQTAIHNTPNPGGTLMLRVYVPVDPTSPQGGVPLPAVTWQTTDGTVLSAPAGCSSQLPSTSGVIADELNSLSFPADAPTTGAPPIPAWKRAAGSPYAGAYGNQQNAYMTSTISRANGNLVVIHAKAATFPNTSAGQPAYKATQLRYWSICENSVDTRVISCAPDYQAALRNGYYTYVISDPSSRPTNAIAQDGVTWLPWGSTDAEGVMILRNMLPSPSFTQAAQDVSSTATNAQQVMGAYYPSAVYCSTAVFEAGGWQACFAAAGV
jgi:hypothetical protein